MLSSEDIEVLSVFREASHWRDGEVVFRSGGETGRIFYTGGKIAWIVTSTIKKTFTAYLTEETGLAEEEVQEVFRECKQTGKNFGETILDWGLLTEPVLRQLLLSHIAECLMEVLSWPAAESMFIPEERKYKGRLTFELSEVLKTVIEMDTHGKLPFSKMSVQQIMSELETKDPDSHPEVASPAGGLASGPDPSHYPRQNDSVDQLEEKFFMNTGQQEEIEDVSGSIKTFVIILVLSILLAAGASYYYRDKLFAADDGMTKAEAGYVKVTSNPVGADIYVDGKQLEEKTEREAQKKKEDDTQPGGSEVSSDDQNKPPESFIAFAQGKGTATIDVITKPPKAKVYIDGIYTKKKTPTKLEAVPASLWHLITVERKGYAPVFKKVKLEDSTDLKVEMRLKKRGKRWKGPALIDVESEPKGAIIFLDGKKIKKKTPSKLKLRMSSEQKIELRLKGYKRWKKTVRAAPGVKLTILAKLEKK